MAAHDTEFTQFAQGAARPLLRAAWLLTGDWGLAQDLVQDTLAAMYVTWPKHPEGLDAPLAYARVVLTRTYLSKRRRKSFWEAPVADVADTAAPPERSDLRLALRQVLSELAPGDRAVLVLRYLADRPVDQVASDLGKTPQAVRAQAHRAVQRVRSALGAEQLLELLAE